MSKIDTLPAVPRPRSPLPPPYFGEVTWRQTGSRQVYDSPWFEVREDTVIRPDGSAGVYHHVATPGAVTVLVADGDRVLVTRQWIYTHGGPQWRLPAGAIDDADPDPRSAAARELAEETGLRAENWECLGAVHGTDSFTNHTDHVFLATGLTEGTPSLEAGEADLELHWMPFDKALALVAAQEIRHAGSAYGLLTLGLRRASGH